MLLSVSGRRKPRRKVVRLVALSADDIFAGIDGMYLKLGNSRADATEDAFELRPGKEEALIRILLNGWMDR